MTYKLKYICEYAAIYLFGMEVAFKASGDRDSMYMCCYGVIMCCILGVITKGYKHTKTKIQ